MDKSRMDSVFMRFMKSFIMLTKVVFFLQQSEGLLLNDVWIVLSMLNGCISLRFAELPYTPVTSR